MAPEVLCGYQYTKASDIYSFGIIMNEFISEETPYSNIPHDHVLTIKICKGIRPKISQDTPKLLAVLITKCWDAKAENRPTAKELYQMLNKWCYGRYDDNTEFYSQMNVMKLVEVNSKTDQVKINPKAPKHIHKQYILVDF